MEKLCYVTQLETNQTGTNWPFVKKSTNDEYLDIRKTYLGNLGANCTLYIPSGILKNLNY